MNSRGLGTGRPTPQLGHARRIEYTRSRPPGRRDDQRPFTELERLLDGRAEPLGARASAADAVDDRFDVVELMAIERRLFGRVP